MTPINKGKSARFYIYKNQKIAKRLYIYFKKIYFSKSKTICVMFYSQKARHFMLRNFYKFLEIGIYIYKKHTTLHYVMFSYTKSQKL